MKENDINREIKCLSFLNFKRKLTTLISSILLIYIDGINLNYIMRNTLVTRKIKSSNQLVLNKENDINREIKCLSFLNFKRKLTTLVCT